MNTFLASGAHADFYSPDGPYAFRRMALSLLISTIVCVGAWAVIVVLPAAQAEFGVDRAAASLPYTLAMFGFAFGTLVLGRMADRMGISIPLLIIASVCILGADLVVAGLAPTLCRLHSRACADRGRGWHGLRPDDG